MTFAKVFRQIFDSSIAEDPYVRHMFMDLLILADPDGVVDMTAGAIAARTRLPKEDVVRWIEALEAPDLESRTPDEDGRRIVRLDPNRTWGWRIVNYRRYRENATREMIRQAEAQRKRAFRQRRAASPPPHTPPPTRTEKEVEEEREPEMSRVRPGTSRTSPDTSGTCPGQGTHSDWPTLDEVLVRAQMRGIPEDCARKWWLEHDARGGCDRHGQPLRRWESALIAFASSWRAVDNQQRARREAAPDHSKGFFG